MEAAFDLVFRAGFHIPPSPPRKAQIGGFETILRAETFLICRLSEV
jgi:hypothetical protein